MTSTQKQNLRTFYTIVLTQTFSMIGSRISGLAIGFWIFAETGEATPLTLVAFFSALPMVLASAFSGVMADRWDRRYVMVISDVGQAVATVFLLLSFMSGAFEIWHLYVLSFIQSIFGVFQGPAFQASITMLIPDNQRDRANAIQQMVGPASGIIAPAIAGVIYALVGVIGAIVIDLLTFLVAIVVIFAVRIPRPTETEEGRLMKGTVWQEMIGGFKYLFKRRVLFGMVLYVSLLNFLVPGAMVLSTPYILARTGSEATLGVLLSIMNVGGLLGGIVISVWGGTRPRIYTVLVSMMFSGLAIIGIGLSQNPITLGLSMFLMMFPIAFVNAPYMSIIQAKVAPDVQGRVFAVMGQFAMLLMPFSMLLSGPLADQVFEPMVNTDVWSTFAPFVGNEPGAGMAMIYVIYGAICAVSALIVLSIPAVRTMEADLPDYVPEAIEDNETSTNTEGELTPEPA